MGWGLAKAGRYALLRKITPEAWQMISQAFQSNHDVLDMEGREEISQRWESKRNPFSEHTLGDIVHLTAPQQLELIKL